MNRLSPLIVRRTDAFVAPRAAARAVAWDQAIELDRGEPAKWLEDLKLFATGWVGGLIFFGTYLG